MANNSIDQKSQKIKTQAELTMNGNPDTITVKTKDGTFKTRPAAYVLYDEETQI